MWYASCRAQKLKTTKFDINCFFLQICINFCEFKATHSNEKVTLKLALERLDFCGRPGPKKFSLRFLRPRLATAPGAGAKAAFEVFLEKHKVNVFYEK